MGDWEVSTYQRKRNFGKRRVESEHIADFRLLWPFYRSLYFTSHWASKASQWFGEELGKDSEEALSMGRMAMARDSSGPSTAQAERLGWQRRSVEEWEDLCG